MDAGFPASGVDGDALVMDQHNGRCESRYSALFYLNDDFEGGATRSTWQTGPTSTSAGTRCLPTDKTSIGGRGVGGRRRRGPRSTEVFSGRPKYVIRTDCMYTTEPDPNAHALERTLRPFSPIYDREFLAAYELLVLRAHGRRERRVAALFSDPIRQAKIGRGGWGGLRVAGYYGRWPTTTTSSDDYQSCRRRAAPICWRGPSANQYISKSRH